MKKKRRRTNRVQRSDFVKRGGFCMKKKKKGVKGGKNTRLIDYWGGNKKKKGEGLRLPARLKSCFILTGTKRGARHYYGKAKCHI